MKADVPEETILREKLFHTAVDDAMSKVRRVGLIRGFRAEIS